MENTEGTSRSWFLVLNNPEQHGYEGEPREICEEIVNRWCQESPTRSAACTYCISAEGLKHCHIVVEDKQSFRFGTVKKIFESAHIEITKGNKKEAEDYIRKKGKYAEKGEEVIHEYMFGEIKGAQGKRKDLEIIRELVEKGKTPAEIFDIDVNYRRHERIVKQEYYAKRNRETPFMRDIEVIWHIGESGSGKSYAAKKIIDDRGENNVYFVSNTENGYMDEYNGEPILFIDEFRGMKYSNLLSMLDKYKTNIPARYQNVRSLWTEVHITSVIPVEKIYYRMVSENRDSDVIQQLLRRITKYIYHWRDGTGYHEYVLDGKDYINYECLKLEAKRKSKVVDLQDYINEGFEPVQGTFVF